MIESCWLMQANLMDSTDCPTFAWMHACGARQSHCTALALQRRGMDCVEFHQLSV
jgi:hypothetical protein